jgi:hypothetical protein
MAIHPVGPLPASTYWLRRAALLVGVVVLLLVARSCVGGEGGGGNDTTSTPTTSPTPKPSASSSPRAGGAACANADLSVTTDTKDEIYPIGGRPQLSVTIKNTSSTSCTRDLGSGAVELLVFSGNDRVWSSDDCTTNKARDVVTLAAGGEKTIPVTWSGKRSKPECAGTRDQAKAGTYRLTARVGTLRSGEAIFRFRN